MIIIMAVFHKLGVVMQSHFGEKNENGENMRQDLQEKHSDQVLVLGFNCPPQFLFLVPLNDRHEDCCFS